MPPSVVEGDIAIPALAGAGRPGAVIGAPGRKFLADNAAVLSAANEDGDDDGDNEAGCRGAAAVVADDGDADELRWMKLLLLLRG